MVRDRVREQESLQGLKKAILVLVHYIFMRALFRTVLIEELLVAVLVTDRSHFIPTLTDTSLLQLHVVRTDKTSEYRRQTGVSLTQLYAVAINDNFR